MATLTWREIDRVRCFMDIAFCGAPFHGWQRQPGDISVQQCLEDAFSKVLRAETAVTGAGRTDAGVNARRMVAHVDLPDGCDTELLVRSVNAIVGHDIAVSGLRRVSDEAHARFDATRRTYRYFAHTSKDPFFRQLSWKASPALDFEAMNVAAALLLGTHDFTSFAKLHSDARTNICRMDAAAWLRVDADHWYFEISADRFLRNMVRAVVGTLVEVGRGKMAPSEIMDVLEAEDRCAAGVSMPAHALFLWDVEYPY